MNGMNSSLASGSQKGVWQSAPPRLLGLSRLQKLWEGEQNEETITFWTKTNQNTGTGEVSEIRREPSRDGKVRRKKESLAVT